MQVSGVWMGFLGFGGVLKVARCTWVCVFKGSRGFRVYFFCLIIFGVVVFVSVFQDSVVEGFRKSLGFRVQGLGS